MVIVLMIRLVMVFVLVMCFYVSVSMISGLKVVLKFVYVFDIKLSICVLGLWVMMVVMMLMVRIDSCLILISLCCVVLCFISVWQMFLVSEDEVISNWFEIVDMIVVSSVVYRKLVISGWNSRFDRMMKIVLGFDMVSLVCSVQVWLKMLMVIVLISDMIIYDMQMLCVVGMLLMLWIVMKWMMICGWLKQFRFYVIVDSYFSIVMFLVIEKYFGFSVVSWFMVGLIFVLLLVVRMMMGMMISVSIMMQFCMKFVRLMVRKLLMVVQISIKFIVSRMFVMQLLLKVLVNSLLLLIRFDVV